MTLVSMTKEPLPDTSASSLVIPPHVKEALTRFLICSGYAASDSEAVTLLVHLTSKEVLNLFWHVAWATKEIVE